MVGTNRSTNDDNHKSVEIKMFCNFSMIRRQRPT